MKWIKCVQKLTFFYDKIFKFIASNNLTSFFLFFNINCLPFFLIENELIDAKLNKLILDLPVLTMYGIVDVEFQLKTSDLDEKRFIDYVIGLYKKYNLDTYIVIIDFELEKNKKRILRINPKDRLTMHYKSLIQRNPDKILNILNYKLENISRFAGKDIVGLELLPLLD